jgi:hypothetical protein
MSRGYRMVGAADCHMRMSGAVWLRLSATAGLGAGQCIVTGLTVELVDSGDRLTVELDDCGDRLTVESWHWCRDFRCGDDCVTAG